MEPFKLTVLLFCLITYGHGRPSDTDERDDIARETKRGKHFQQYQLPYWVFVPSLGVWPGGVGGATGTKASNDTVVPLLHGSKTVGVDIDNGEVTVVDARPEVDGSAAVPVDQPKQQRQPSSAVQIHPNTPSVGGPSLLRKTAAAAAKEIVTRKPETKVYLKPMARAKAGAGGLALSNPISTAVVRRGDTVSIEYTPEAVADVGEGGVAISRPELIIHFVD